MTDDRLTNLELSVTHLERAYEQMHEVLLAVQLELTQLQRTILRLENRFDALGEEADPRDPLGEKPPHY